MKSIIFKVIIACYSFIINALSLINNKWAAALAIHLFQTPRAGRPNAWQEKFLRKHHSGFISVGDMQISSYHWAGSSKNILLIHGWESNSSRWKPYINALLERGFNVYAIDAPAHGLSSGKYFTPVIYADAIEKFIDDKQIDIIMGHSVGAYTTLLYCNRPQRHASIRHMILLAPTGNLRDFMNQFFDLLSVRAAVRDYFFDNFESKYNHEVSFFDSDNLVKSVSLEGLLIHDIDDKTLPYKDSVLIADNWSNGKFITTQGFGHSLKSTEVYKHIFNYIDQIN